MTETELLEYMKNGGIVKAGSDMHGQMHKISQRAIKITSALNGSYHEPQEIREIFSELIGKKVDNGLNLFPPFYTDCGFNITVGKNVFINSDCKFQDWGGITIGDGALIGHSVVFATLNHGFSPDTRHDNFPKPITVGKNVWIGSNTTILPGITIGNNAVVAAGAVVTKDIPENTVVGGVPARVIKNI